MVKLLQRPNVDVQCFSISPHGIQLSLDASPLAMSDQLELHIHTAITQVTLQVCHKFQNGRISGITFPCHNTHQ